jgi:diaminohydroxyphosphoribosylaminopyrimidine deaminase/5-amino-6-(5-phosphoribosylamino)uracil reductase
MNQDEQYMSRALQIAQWGVGKVAPNPMVGCVIVAQNRIIGEGWHAEYGQAHAEVNAVADVRHEDTHLFPESTFYVSLEPCNHTGKTPPCTDLLLRVKPQKVVICNTDSNPIVAGKGIARLREAGIEVVTGILEKEGKELNKRFFTYHTQKRPYLILKWAKTADNFIAREDYSSKWISNAQARQLVHQWRAEEQAIMVGANTALYDNPSLTVRDFVGKNPIRIVVGRQDRLPIDSHIFNQEAPTLAYQNDLPTLLQKLYEQQIISVLVEGGAKLLNSFLEADLFDEIREIQAPDVCFEKGIKAPIARGILVEQKKISKNLINFYKK